MAVTTEEMIAVMQAFVDGKSIEEAYIGGDRWKRARTPVWDWDCCNYRVALTKPSWDWSHVSDKINFLVRQSPAAGGMGRGCSHLPVKSDNAWLIVQGQAFNARAFASYDPGTCDWQDSLVVRPGYVEGDQ